MSLRISQSRRLRWLTVAIYLAAICPAVADSAMWTFRTNFIYDPWNEPILEYLATIPQGQPVEVKNIRAQIKALTLAALKTQANGERVVKTKVIKSLQNAADVASAKTLLLPNNDALQVGFYQTVASYFDQWGLLGIMQLIATWQCEADEKCPEKITQNLAPLLAVGGKFVKREVFTEAAGQAWIVATVSYEVPVGQELKVVPLRSRKLQVQQVP